MVCALKVYLTYVINGRCDVKLMRTIKLCSIKIPIDVCEISDRILMIL